MKFPLAIIIILSFTASAVFGLAAMSHGQNMAHGGCVAEIAALAKGAPCPLAATPFEFANFHLGVWRNFSIAVFGSNILDSLLIILALFAALIALRLAPARFERVIFAPASQFLEF